jgi:hypothetical protein
MDLIFKGHNALLHDVPSVSHINSVITAKVRIIHKDGFETDHTRYRHA